MKKRTKENIGLVIANIVLILLCFMVLIPGEHPKVCVNLQTDVR